VTDRPHRRSLVLDVALKVGLATMAVSLVVLALIYNVLAGQSEAALAHTVDTDMAGLVDTFGASGSATGPDDLARRISDRLALTPSGSEQPYYLLLSTEGHRLAGNVAGWPALSAAGSESGRVQLASGETAWMRGTMLRGGWRLLVGRSTSQSDASLKQIAWLFGLALLAIPACAFFIGRLAARSLKTRILGINHAFERVGDEGVALRAPLSSANDELDLLGRHVNLALDRIDRLLTAQRDVSDHIAHETRTPLMLLDQRIKLAIDAAPSAAVLDNLFVAQSEVRNLLRLLDALLDIAAAEAQRGDLRTLGRVNLTEIAYSLSELYAPSAEDLGVSLVSAIAPDVTVQADAMQVTRLLVNLLDNALKYGAAGKVIRLSVTAGPVIVVEDDGPGLAPEDRERIFQRYQRATRGAEKGHGLGLALVRAIAERHGWAIHVEDAQRGRANRGARFIVRPREPS
jgi:signal transduction histidine kinase